MVFALLNSGCAPSRKAWAFWKDHYEATHDAHWRAIDPDVRLWEARNAARRQAEMSGPYPAEFAEDTAIAVEELDTFRRQKRGITSPGLVAPPDSELSALIDSAANGVFVVHPITEDPSLLELLRKERRR